jgi:hypothetical protein
MSVEHVNICDQVSYKKDSPAINIRQIIAQKIRTLIVAGALTAGTFIGSHETKAESSTTIDHGPLCEKVDVIEINHFYDENGTHVFNQMIFREWVPKDSRFQIIGWRLMKEDRGGPSKIPQVKWNPNGEKTYVSIWNDGEFLRKIEAQSMTETWTQYDPEVLERNIFPKENRPDLLKPRWSR